MVMQAKIKCNQTTKDQARTILAALRNSFTSAQVGVVLEEIDYVPNPVRSIDLVFQDVNTKLPADQVEIVLLDWMPHSGEPSMFKIQDGRILCNLKANRKYSLTTEKVMEEFTRHIFSLKAKEFAKASPHTLKFLDELRGFYLASQKTVSALPRVLTRTADAFQSKIIIDRSKEIWVQVSEFNRIKLPLANGWEKALYFFILKNKKGFSFNNFNRSGEQDSRLLAEMYVLTKPYDSINEIMKQINYRVKEGQISKFFSPHFTRLRNKIAGVMGHHELFHDLKIVSSGKKKDEDDYSNNIRWDRFAIIWE
jgi:hypothetical protein